MKGTKNFAKNATKLFPMLIAMLITSKQASAKGKMEKKWKPVFARDQSIAENAAVLIAKGQTGNPIDAMSDGA